MLPARPQCTCTADGSGGGFGSQPTTTRETNLGKVAMMASSEFNLRLTTLPSSTELLYIATLRKSSEYLSSSSSSRSYFTMLEEQAPKQRVLVLAVGGATCSGKSDLVSPITWTAFHSLKTTILFHPIRQDSVGKAPPERSSKLHDPTSRRLRTRTLLDPFSVSPFSHVLPLLTGTRTHPV